MPNFLAAIPGLSPLQQSMRGEKALKSCAHPLVTVIVPVYKVEYFLPRCIDSILNQSYRNLEIILVDDGSPDQCPIICDNLQEKDSRVIVIHKDNGGLSSARNVGIQLAKGDYLCFVDSDDYISSDMIEQLVLAAHIKNAPISACSFTSDENLLQNGITEEVRLFSAADALYEILNDRAFCTSAWAKLFDRKLFDNIVFPEGKYYEDYGTIYKLIHKAGTIAFSDVKKYYYTINISGITKGGFSHRQMDYFFISQELEIFLAENYPEYLKIAHFRAMNMAISLYKKIAQSPDRAQFEEDRTALLEIIKLNSAGFLFSDYPLKKKVAGLMISFFPRFSERLLS